MRITNEQIKEIEKLGKEGKKQSEIANSLKIKAATVWYHIDPERKKIKIDNQIDLFRNKSLKERKIIYKQRRDYMRNYMKTRYWENRSFREKMKQRARDYTKEKKK